MHAYTPVNNISDGPVTNLLSILCILIEFLSGAPVKGWKSQNGFKLDTSIGHFPTERAARMAVNGLINPPATASAAVIPVSRTTHSTGRLCNDA